MNTVYIVLITLIIYSVIATIVYIISGENDEVIAAFGLGIFGLALWGVMNIIHKIKNQFKWHIGKRSIFKNRFTGELFKCKVKEAVDMSWMYDYKIVKRYAAKDEWRDIQDFSAEFIELSKCNCSNCKYDKECVHDDRDYPYYNAIRCKHNEYGNVVEFDKFEKK